MTNRIETRPIAGSGHTIGLAALLGTIGLLGAYGWAHREASAGHARSAGSHAAMYVSALVFELLLLRGVLGGLRKDAGGWRAVVGAGFLGCRGMLTDLALALTAQAIWIAPAVIFGARNGSATVSSALPKGALDLTLWVALSFGAGICEEFAFRGYFLRQLSALWRKPALALAAQALLFGAIHAYQGPGGVLSTAMYGAMLGLVTLWRGNTRSAMAAHTMTDLTAVLWMR
ncbi:MAG: CPBP family intramembrane glutamic endopeptidase [Bryobacteraceae bacterium]